jgi:hypothetical protein
MGISGSTSLAQLHHIIQIAMNWDNDHPHKFPIYAKEYGISYPGGNTYLDEPDDVNVDQFEFEAGDRFIYTYNYFSHHVHDIRVESIDQLKVRTRFV